MGQVEQKSQIGGSKTSPNELKFQLLVDHIHLMGKDLLLMIFNKLNFLNNPISLIGGHVLPHAKICIGGPEPIRTAHNDSQKI